MSRSCPNCGAQVAEMLTIARVQACEYCGTTLVQNDSVLEAAGSAGQMFEAPALFTLGQTCRIGARRFTPLGVIQYYYGRGVWDEYWGQDGDGNPVWVSVDEGDVAWQVALDQAPAGGANLFKLNAMAIHNGLDYTATEVNSASCRGFRGQLPEAVEIGETHMFVNMTTTRGMLLSGERWGAGQEAWYAGEWIDPFEVRQT